MSKAAPSVDDELKFFGGKECIDVRNKLLTKDIYKNSQTAIWDYLRLNRDAFITKNLKNIEQFLAIYSEPFESVRAWNNHKVANKKVYVSFPEELTNPEKSVFHGRSSIVFTLGEACYLDIGATVGYPSSINLMSIETIGKLINDK